MSKLFSTEKNKIEVVYTFLGMRFRRKRKESVKQRLNKLHDELQNHLEALRMTVGKSIDPKAMPKASGYTRIVQMLCLQGLSEIDRICRKHNLSYWLAFGTLLGAVRHGGFIPWDDDLDLCMMADYYHKFLKVVD